MGGVEGYFKRIDLSYFEGGGKDTEKVEIIEKVVVPFLRELETNAKAPIP
jgi:hypothetical protein